MNRHAFLSGVAACGSMISFTIPSCARPTIYPHDRLGEVWEIMKRTPGSVASKQAAVEAVFGAGILQFGVDCYGGWAVLVDTRTASFFGLNGATHDTVSQMNVRVVAPARFDRGWQQGPPMRHNAA